MDKDGNDKDTKKLDKTVEFIKFVFLKIFLSFDVFI